MDGRTAGDLALAWLKFDRGGLDSIDERRLPRPQSRLIRAVRRWCQEGLVTSPDQRDRTTMVGVLLTAMRDWPPALVHRCVLVRDSATPIAACAEHGVSVERYLQVLSELRRFEEVAVEDLEFRTRLTAADVFGGNAD